MERVTQKTHIPLPPCLCKVHSQYCLSKQFSSHDVFVECRGTVVDYVWHTILHCSVVMIYVDIDWIVAYSNTTKAHKCNFPLNFLMKVHWMFPMSPQFWSEVNVYIARLITSPRAHFSVTSPRGQSLSDNGHRQFLQGAPTVTIWELNLEQCRECRWSLYSMCSPHFLFGKAWVSKLTPGPIHCKFTSSSNDM